MAAIQKINHLKVHRLVVKGRDVAPVEAPAPLPEEPTLDQLVNAYEDLVDRLTEAGILIEAAEAPETDAQPAE